MAFARAMAVLAVVAAQPAHPQEKPSPDEQAIDKAGTLITQHKPEEALQLLDPAISNLEKMAADARSKGLVFCATNMPETLAYSIVAANQRKSGIVLGASLCNALFFKAYALTDLGKKTEAIATLEELTALAPMHGHYFVELGYAYRVDNQPDKARKAYEKAIDGSAAGNPDQPMRDRAAGYRGLGYLMVDQGDLDGAEKAYRESLEYDPDNPIAKSELEYIKTRRSK